MRLSTPGRVCGFARGVLRWEAACPDPRARPEPSRGRWKGAPCLARLVVVLLVGLPSCATTNLTPLGSEPVVLSGEEQALWRETERAEVSFEEADRFHASPELDAYLGAITRSLAPELSPELASRLRVRVLRDPYLNAFAWPHGAIVVNTGLLARVDNEAQLAAVLAHELSHFTHRHVLRESRKARNQAVTAGVLAGVLIGAGAAAGVDLGGVGGALGTTWMAAVVSGYSRDLETEADEEGLRRVVAAGFDPGEAQKVFEHLRDEVVALGVEEPYFFGSHPSLQERIDNHKRLLSSEYDARGGVRNQVRFLRVTVDVLLENAELDLAIARPEVARAAIEKHLSLRPESARAYFLRAESFRRFGSRDDGRERTIADYRAAIDLDPTYAQPHLELGLVYRAQERHAQARAELERYLALSPDAADSEIVRGYLEALGPAAMALEPETGPAAWGTESDPTSEVRLTGGRP